MFTLYGLGFFKLSRARDAIWPLPNFCFCFWKIVLHAGAEIHAHRSVCIVDIVDNGNSVKALKDN